MGAPKGNRFALGNNGGRPRIFETPEELEAKVYEYFQEAIENKWDLTITGLALFLGFSSRGTLNEYGNKKEYSDIIKRAQLAVENGYEHNLNTFKYGGAVFALKNMGWKDQQEQTVTQTIVNVTPQVRDSGPEIAGNESNVSLD